MAKWSFWGEKEFSDVYENIYIRALNEDWFGIISAIVNEINSVKSSGRKSIIDIGCGEGHTTKQILDRIKGPYICDLLEPNENALLSAEAYLRPENNIGELYQRLFSTFKPNKKYDVICTIHTNYYWALNEKDYKEQLVKLLSFLKPNGKLLILTLPAESGHYKIMLSQIYPTFNYAQYIIDFYKKLGSKVEVKKLKMRIFIGDILNTNKLFDLKTLYRFIHNENIYPNSAKGLAFLKKILKYQKKGYLDFKDYLIIVKNSSGGA